MEVKLSDNYGFCFGVKRAIKIAEESPNSHTIGPLIHNPKEIERLSSKYSVDVIEEIDILEPNERAIVRTHGIEKERLQKLKEKNIDIIDATCPYVTKPQEIVEIRHDPALRKKQERWKLPVPGRLPEKLDGHPKARDRPTGILQVDGKCANALEPCLGLQGSLIDQ